MLTGTEAVTDGGKTLAGSPPPPPHADPGKGAVTKYCKSGSITPTTEGKVEFNPFVLENALNDLQKDRKMLLGTGESGEINSKIMHSYRREVEIFHIVEKKCENLFFTIEYGEDINSKNPKGPLVKRFGINPAAVNPVDNYGIAGNALHFIEEKILDSALAELGDKPSAEEAQSGAFAHNVVVVDIFARDGGILKIDSETGLREMHSIVLWKKAEDCIVLIDPNKREFSQHIAKSLNSMCGEEKYKLGLEGVIYSSKRKYPSQPEKTGRSNYKQLNPNPRDCIDIAVKIAFEINEQQYAIIEPCMEKEARKLAIEEIAEKVCIQISNNSIIKKFSTLIDNTFIRQIQSTQKDIRKSSNEVLLNKQLHPILEELKVMRILNPSYKLIKKMIKPRLSAQKVLKTYNALAQRITRISKEHKRALEDDLKVFKEASQTFSFAKYIEERLNEVNEASKKWTTDTSVEQIKKVIELLEKDEDVLSEELNEKNKESKDKEKV
jgi:hypothetical protein